MDWSAADLPGALRKFKAICDLIFEGPMHEREEELKVKYLQIWSGEEGIELISTWQMTDAEKKSLDTYWTKFSAYVTPKSNFRISRFRLRSLKQQPQEAVDAFAKRIRMLVAECGYVNNDDHMIDALIYGTKLKSVQSKLLQKDATMTFDQALDVARLEEATQQQLLDLSETAVVHATKHQKRDDRKPKACGRCNKEHSASPRSKCPAYGTTCSKCGKRNHWAVVCRQETRTPQLREDHPGSTKPRPKPRSKIHEMTTEEDHTEEPLYFNTLEIAHLASDELTQAMVEVGVQTKGDACKKKLTCKIDTGAEGNVLPVALYRRIVNKSDADELTELQKSKTVIKAYGGSTIPQYGTCKLTLTHAQQTVESLFHVVKCSGPAILGLPSCRALNLVTLNLALNIDDPPDIADGDPKEKNVILEEFSDCFKGIGCFEGEYKITLDPDVPPVVHPPRRVPISLRDKLKDELDKLQSQDILDRVVKPTDWVNSCVCTTKANGALRLCQKT